MMTVMTPPPHHLQYHPTMTTMATIPSVIDVAINNNDHAINVVDVATDDDNDLLSPSPASSDDDAHLPQPQ